MNMLGLLIRIAALPAQAMPGLVEKMSYTVKVHITLMVTQLKEVATAAS